MTGAKPPRRRLALRASVVLVALLLTVAVAEAGASALLHHRLATAVGRALGKHSQVRVDGGPALLLLFERRLGAVTVRSGHADVGRLCDVSVQARLDDVRLTGNHSGSVAHTHAKVRVPASSVRGLAAATEGRIPVTAVRLDGDAGTVTLVLGQAGLGRATLRPEVRDGRVTLDVQDVEVLGSPAPAAVVDRLRSTLSARSGTAYPLGLRATSLDVTDTGLDVTLDGGAARLPARAGRPPAPGCTT
ncbi:LmeA family phospholipid-binding protein [Streptomyces sp. NPDC058964]|uniref:LmeA family phospholipid-binding protein n=1 Tax=Streptomyces sp. NPDC058964 TaxID=3346681 RepID=UPI0036BEB02A